MAFIPNGWTERWRFEAPDDEDDPVRVIVDEKPRRPGVSTVVAEIYQGEHSVALAAYIVTLHNANLPTKEVGRDQP